MKKIKFKRLQKSIGLKTSSPFYDGHEQTTRKQLFKITIHSTVEQMHLQRTLVI